MKTVETGDRVQYKAEFLRNIGVYTGVLPQAKGEVVEINGVLATLKWEQSFDGSLPAKVNVNNLKRVTDWEPN